MRTAPTYSNCFFGLIYLLLRGKVTGLVGASTTGGLWPCHFVTVGKHGVIHFTPVGEHSDNPHGPWWFYGSYEGISFRTALQRLHQSGRRVLWKIDGAAVVWVVVVCLLVMLTIPWLICWACWPVAWTAWWACQAIKRRVS